MSACGHQLLQELRVPAEVVWHGRTAKDKCNDW